MSVDIPKMAVVFGSVTPPQGDVVDLMVHLGCTKEVSSFDCLLQNWDGKYSPSGTYPINVGVDGHIDVGRGTNVPQIITLRVEKVQCLSPTSTEHYIRVSGRCWGEKLFRKVVTKTYDSQKGEAIVKDLMDSYVGLSHVRAGTELIEDTDTTFTHLEYENTPVWDILKYIAESSDKVGVIGYDFRVAPDGKFEFFPKNSKTSPVSLSETIEDSEYRKDISRIRNKITVYGCQGKNFPANLDLWSESLDGWTCDSGTLELESVRQREGSHCLEVWTPGGGGEATIHRTFDILVKPQTFVVWAWMPGNLGGGTGYVILLAPDSANYFVGDIKSILEGKCILQWGLLSLALGSSQMYDANHNPNGIWTKVGNPQWNQISGLKLIMNCVGASSYIFWDGDFGFLNCSYTGTSENTDSQDDYGLRELTETDEELVSDNECELRAKALLAYLSDPAEYLNLSSTIIDYGTTPLLPADKIHVTLPNENVDSDFRIETVEYHVDAKTQTLEITLELGKVPPLLADYLYGLRATTITVEKLARTKLGKGVFPTAWSGGLGAHHQGHEAGDDNGVQWPSQDKGGWDKITGWVCPKHIGPFDDAAAIINFRTKNKAGTTALDHQFQPSNNEHGVLGCETAHWKELHSKFLVLYHSLFSPYGDFRIKNQGDANPLARLTEDRLEFGSGGALAPDIYLKRIADNKFEFKAQYLEPQADNILEVGSPTKKVKLLYVSTLLLPTDGYLHIQVYGEENPKARLTQDSIAFGLGGVSTPDTGLKRVDAGKLELNAELLPTADQSGYIGSATKRFAKIYAVEIAVSNMLFNFNLVPDADNTYDLGSSPKRWKDIYLAGAIKALAGGVAVNLLPDVNATRDLGSSTVKWSNLYLSGVCDVDGWLNVAGFTVITNARVLQNVIAAAGIITSGRFSLARLPDGTSAYFLKAQGAGFDPVYALLSAGDIPSLDASKITSGRFPLARLLDGTAGYVLEAEGSGFDPMYVNPNGRYTPAAHNHGAGDITSGVFAEARIPHTYANLLTLNGGLTMGAGLNMNACAITTVNGITFYGGTLNMNTCPIANVGSLGADSITVNTLSVVTSVNCKNWVHADILFNNEFRITEAENVNLGHGLVFLNPKGKVIMLLDENGNIEIFGKLEQNSSRLKSLWLKMKRNAKKVIKVR